MFAFGLVGILMQELDYPVGPFVLGFILGPMAEDNLRRGLVITAGDPSPFFTRPIALVLFALLVLSILGPTGVGRSIHQGLGRYGPINSPFNAGFILEDRADENLRRAPFPSRVLRVRPETSA